MLLQRYTVESLKNGRLQTDVTRPPRQASHLASSVFAVYNN